jgi:alkanesulfonate monooxygenase SsuD/methylene tetrahydromethanopterin reductase-like flavin-dependent oxidoreductase (luciferase family)
VADPSAVRVLGERRFGGPGSDQDEGCCDAWHRFDRTKGVRVDYGMFSMPLRPPGGDITAAYHRDVEGFVLGDRLGYTEGWMGEHYTIPWEPMPASDLFVSHVLARTENIRLGTGVTLLPMNDPRQVALRIAYLDHLSKGRLNFGIGAGGAPTDFKFYDIDNKAGEHRARMRESIDVILRLWTEDEPFTHDGEFWQFSVPEPMMEVPLYHHLRPYQTPHPPIAVAGLHKASESLMTAGARGWIPMSINYLPAKNLLTHWDAVKEGASSAGRTPDRRQWRIAREIFVAPTDEEARDAVLGGVMARAYSEYMINVLKSLGISDLYKEDPDMPDTELTAEYVCDNIFVVGSPDTVTEKLTKLYDDVGGFGTVLQLQYTSDPWGQWKECMRLFAEEVMPNLKHLVPSNED